MGYANLRKLFEDDRIHAIAARVALHEGETEWWRVNAEGDVVVDCITLQHAVPVTANLGALVGGAGNGVWQIPGLDVEVMLASDNGRFEAELYLVGYFPSGASPAGLAPGKVLIIGSAVEIRTAASVASPVATLADVSALASYVQTMVLPVAPAPPPASGQVAGPPVPGTVPAPSGTTVLKAE